MTGYFHNPTPPDPLDYGSFLPQTWAELRAAFREWLEEVDYTTAPHKASESARPFPADWKSDFTDWLDTRAYCAAVTAEIESRDELAYERAMEREYDRSYA